MDDCYLQWATDLKEYGGVPLKPSATMQNRYVYKREYWATERQAIQRALVILHCDTLRDDNGYVVNSPQLEIVHFEDAQEHLNP